MPAFCALRTSQITQKRTPSMKLVIKPHIMTMLCIPTTWRRNAVTIHMVEIMTSRHPIYSNIGGGSAQLVATLVRSAKLLYAGPG